MPATQHDASLESAVSWRNDELAFYTAQDSEPGAAPKVLAVWRLRFDNALSATEFVQAIAPLQLSVTAFERELAISASSRAQLPPLAADALSICPSAQAFTASLPASVESVEQLAQLFARCRAERMPLFDANGLFVCHAAQSGELVSPVTGRFSRECLPNVVMPFDAGFGANQWDVPRACRT